MDTHITGVGVGITDRFRSVVEEKVDKVQALSPKAQQLEVRVRHESVHRGRLDEETVELTVHGRGPVIRAEARDADKFVALDQAMDKLLEQLRRAKDRRVTDRHHPRSARLSKQTGSLEGLDVEPADVEVIRAVATGSIPIAPETPDDSDDYTPVVIRTKLFDAEWMSVEDAVDRMELVGHDFFLFIDVATDHPSVVYRRRGWDYGVISLDAEAPPAASALAS